MMEDVDMTVSCWGSNMEDEGIDHYDHQDHRDAALHCIDANMCHYIDFRPHKCLCDSINRHPHINTGVDAEHIRHLWKKIGKAWLRPKYADLDPIIAEDGSTIEV
eukprot:6475635-Amphidinium_carterae.1